MAALTEYQRHAELYGPDSVLETAAHELDQRDLAQLAGYVAHLERIGKFVSGRWVPRHAKQPRKCDGCGLDLPLDARANRRFHDSACSKRAARSRDSQATRGKGAGTPRNPDISATRTASRRSGDAEGRVQAKPRLRRMGKIV